MLMGDCEDKEVVPELEVIQEVALADSSLEEESNMTKDEFSLSLQIRSSSQKEIKIKGIAERTCSSLKNLN